MTVGRGKLEEEAVQVLVHGAIVAESASACSASQTSARVRRHHRPSGAERSPAPCQPARCARGLDGERAQGAVRPARLSRRHSLRVGTRGRPLARHGCLVRHARSGRFRLQLHRAEAWRLESRRNRGVDDGSAQLHRGCTPPGGPRSPVSVPSPALGPASESCVSLARRRGCYVCCCRLRGHDCAPGLTRSLCTVRPVRVAIRPAAPVTPTRGGRAGRTPRRWLQCSPTPPSARSGA